MVKNKKDAGADMLTPSIPQYFSWINNTNEGATEKQTMVNLDFFDYMKKTYGMEIKIYAWDAGNFDGSSRHYGAEETEKLKEQYPNGYAPIVERAKKAGIRLGLWGSPDGFGNDPETEKNRYDFFVHLCRDYNFAEFKLDGVCGPLRESKAPVFAKMLRECREYSPDLVVLNHRLNLYEAEKHITTFLFNSGETYVDVLINNRITAMHNRAYMFSRGHVEGLNRLAEDHGVCISSGIDYFEDELIYQAFSRCLILAPEIYGNPWLMRDDELAKLARVYNLHRRNAPILVDGKLLDEKYGCQAISRGSKTKKFICTGNDTWEAKKISLNIRDMGIETSEKVCVNIHHPYEKRIGIFNADDTVEIELMPFRATLIEVAIPGESEPMIENCEYEIIKEDKDGNPLEVKYFSGEKPNCKYRADTKEKAPRFIGKLTEFEKNPADGKYLYEVASFAVTNDSLERRSANRAGETKIPEVKAARDAFFNQARYKLRGCDNANMFDGDPDTFFDAQSRNYKGEDLRIQNGCLRVDFGTVYDADAVEIICFEPYNPIFETREFSLPFGASVSENLKAWHKTGMPACESEQENYEQGVVKFSVHNTENVMGRKLKVTYKADMPFRYLRIDNPMDRIFSVKLLKNGKYIDFKGAKANNMQAPASMFQAKSKQFAEFIIPETEKDCIIAVAVNGECGCEKVYCTAEIDGEYFGFPRRAPDYVANIWEHRVCRTNGNYTFYLPVSKEMSGKRIKINAVFFDDDKSDIDCNVYVCDVH